MSVFQSTPMLASWDGSPPALLWIKWGKEEKSSLTGRLSQRWLPFPHAYFSADLLRKFIKLHKMLRWSRWSLLIHCCSFPIPFHCPRNSSPHNSCHIVCVCRLEDGCGSNSAVRSLERHSSCLFLYLSSPRNLARTILSVSICWIHALRVILGQLLTKA